MEKFKELEALNAPSIAPSGNPEPFRESNLGTPAGIQTEFASYTLQVIATQTNFGNTIEAQGNKLAEITEAYDAYKKDHGVFQGLNHAPWNDSPEFIQAKQKIQAIARDLESKKTEYARIKTEEAARAEKISRAFERLGDEAGTKKLQELRILDGKISLEQRKWQALDHKIAEFATALAKAEAAHKAAEAEQKEAERKLVQKKEEIEWAKKDIQAKAEKVAASWTMLTTEPFDANTELARLDAEIGNFVSAFEASNAKLAVVTIAVSEAKAQLATAKEAKNKTIATIGMLINYRAETESGWNALIQGYQEADKNTKQSISEFRKQTAENEKGLDTAFASIQKAAHNPKISDAGLWAGTIGAVGSWFRQITDIAKKSLDHITVFTNKPAIKWTVGPALNLMTGVARGAINLIGGISTIVEHPADTAKAVASLIWRNPENGEWSFATAGKALKHTGKAIIAYDTFAEGSIMQGFWEVGFNVVTAVVTAGAGSALRAASAAAGATVRNAAGQSIAWLSISVPRAAIVGARTYAMVGAKNLGNAITNASGVVAKMPAAIIALPAKAMAIWKNTKDALLLRLGSIKEKKAAEAEAARTSRETDTVNRRPETTVDRADTREPGSAQNAPRPIPKESILTPEIQAKFDDFLSGKTQSLDGLPTSLHANAVAKRLEHIRSKFGEHATKDPFLRQIQATGKEFLPDSVIHANGRTFYSSKVFHDGKYENAIIYSEEGGRLIPSLAYRSQSSGGWRISPYTEQGAYVKLDGHGHNYVTATKPHRSIAAFLDEQPAIKMQASPYSHRQLFSLANERGNFLSEPRRIGMAAQGSENLQASKPHAIAKSVNEMVRSERGFMPDFSGKPKSEYITNHTLLGNTKIEVYEGVYQWRTVEWHMAHGGDHVWVDHIRFKDSKTGPHGFDAEAIDAGALTYKPLDYVKQVPGGGYSAAMFDRKYMTLQPLLDTFEPILAYRRSRNIPIQRTPQQQRA